MRNPELTKKPDSSIFDQCFPVRLKEAEIYDPTKFTILTGSDGVLDDLFSYQVYNYLKNHWRAAAAPADKQPGMIFSDSDDDKVHHYGAAAWEEILQLTRSNDVSPQFATVRLMDTGADHYLDLKCNENLGAHRLLNIVVGNATRTITFSGNPTLADWFDQAVKQASSPRFVNPRVDTLRLDDTGNDHYLSLYLNENLSANRILNIITGNATRTITFSGNPTLADWFDQAVKQASTVTFGGATINGKFTFGVPTELTIAGGAITVTRSYHEIDTQGDAGTDNLDTINGYVDGMILVLKAIHPSRTVVVRDGAGNIELEGGANMSLDNMAKKLYLFYDDGTVPRWYEISRFNG